MDDRGGGPEETLQELAWRMAAARCLEEIIHSRLGLEISFSGGSGSRDRLETSPTTTTTPPSARSVISQHQPGNILTLAHVFPDLIVIGMSTYLKLPDVHSRGFPWLQRMYLIDYVPYTCLDRLDSFSLVVAAYKVYVFDLLFFFSW
jgi:hypothetical protein